MPQIRCYNLSNRKRAKGARTGSVTGLGGVFFKADNPAALYQWYEKHLGIRREAHGQGASFHWRDPENQDAFTAWAIFPRDSQYFSPSQQPFMLNYRVADLDRLLENLRAAGVWIDPQREDYEYGRFARIMDPEGNRVELWEPPKRR
jgi:D-3-phosphoglycerate dehydrogenase / 2-oxoglutarate reductase